LAKGKHFESKIKHQGDGLMVTEEEFLRYEEVRLSGRTNMLDYDMVEVLARLSKDKILDCMKGYTEFAKKYLKEKK